MCGLGQRRGQRGPLLTERKRCPSVDVSSRPDYRYGLPDGGIDARARRDSRASSVSTFLSVLGGGQTAAFLFDPTDHTDHSRDIKARAAPPLPPLRRPAPVAAVSALPPLASFSSVSCVFPLLTFACALALGLPPSLVALSTPAPYSTRLAGCTERVDQ